MEALFLKLVNMSITASWLVLAIIAVRLIFKKAPKWILCLLWGLVAVRLICPFSIESSLSLIPDTEPLSYVTADTAAAVKQADGDILDSEWNVIVEVRDGIRTYPEKEQEQAQGLLYFFSRIWLVGFGLMLVYTAVSYYLLQKKVATAIPLKRGIKQSEYVDSPFVLGMIRPVIYLPFGMIEEDMAYVIAHEQAHIRRRDHWWKPFGFLLLSVYWFNPVLWVAYILLCRDIEAACDEKVIREMDKDGRRAYSTALLNCSVHRRRIAACPLAFGEIGVKTRVKSVMNYKKPAFWVILIAVVISIAVAVCFLTNPKDVLPVTVDVDYIGRNWADLKFVLDDTYAEGEIQIGDEYILEVQEQGIWREVENLSGKQPAQQVIAVRSDSADFDSWTSINWEEYYGRLSDGTFRLRKDVTIKKGSDDSETQPIYVEFTIGGTADDYVTYTLEDISPTGAKLYEHEKVTDEFQLIYDGSEGIWLESYRDGQWTYVEPTEYIEPILKKDRHYIHQLIYPSDYIQLDWSALYGELSDGTYRIAQEVTNTAQGDLRVCTAYAEFTISGNSVQQSEATVTDADMLAYGSLKMLLPSGFAATEAQGVVVLTKDSVAVGGIRHWTYPDFQPSDIVELKKEESGVPIGYMSGSSAYGDTEYEVFWDGNPDGLNEQHTFFIDGDVIYDVWYDENQISDGIAERFLKTVAINADPVIEENPDEQTAFAKCRAVLEAVQKGNYKVVIRQTTGRNESAVSHEQTYARSGADWLSITNVLPMGADFTGDVEYATTSSRLCVNGKYFSFTGAEWVEIAEMENTRIPRLAEFTWDENIVAYMDTLTDEDGECIMLRVDEQYIDLDAYDPHYFLYFNFDTDGNFVSAQLQVNLFRDNEINITESIASLNAHEINAEIQKEYQRAIG